LMSVHFRIQAACICALIGASACTHSSSDRAPDPTSTLYTGYTAPPIPHPSPSLTPSFKTYPVSAAFNGEGPPLTPEQRKWIRRIISSRAYGKLRPRLRFADMPGWTTPILVYVDRAAPGEADRGGHVIGEACSAEFDPVEHGKFAGSETSCSPPTPEPVN
jgi:hypothetical protein